MNEQIRIQPLAREQRADWTPLWRAYLAFYKTELPDDQFDLTFARYCDPERLDMLGWLAWNGAQAVGLVHVIVHSHGWHAAPVTYLQDLYAVPEVRGIGIGRRLIETVYADADAAGRPTVYWLTQAGNDVARRLYDRIAQPTDFMKYGRS